MEARKEADVRHSIGDARARRPVRFAAAPSLMLAALVLYGSLLPFDFRIERFGVVGLTLADATVADVQTNLLVYLPIGASLLLLLKRRAFGRVSSIVGATLGGSALSLLVEFAQTLLPSRVASWTDVALNTIGSALGAGMALLTLAVASGLIRAIRKERLETPFTLAASLLTIGLFVYQILPCDFVTSTSGLHQALARAQWNPLAAPVTTAARALTNFADDLSGATWFLLLGGLLGLSALEVGRHPLLAVGSAVKQGFALIMTIECLQLLTRSHVAEANSVVMRLMALGLGAWSGVFVVGGARQLAPNERWSPRIVWMPVICAFLFLQISLLFLPGMNCWLGGGWNWNELRLAGLPFDALWRRPGLGGLLDAAGTVVTYATLAASLMILLMRTSIRGPRLVTAGLVLSVAALTETLRAGSGIGSIDVTALPLALVGYTLSARVLDLLTLAPARV